MADGRTSNSVNNNRPNPRIDLQTRRDQPPTIVNPPQDPINTVNAADVRAIFNLRGRTMQLRLLQQFQASEANQTPSNTPPPVDTGRLNQIKELLSYGVFDWSVSANDERRIVDLLKNDPNLSGTIQALHQENRLNDLITRVNEPATRRELIQTLAARTDDATSRLIEPHIRNLDLQTVGGNNAELWQVQYRLTRMGVTPPSQNFDRSRYNDLINANPQTAFTGVGASGFNPANTSIGLIDQARLGFGHDATRARYDNPIPGDLGAYLNSVGDANRIRQAELLLGQPVSSSMTNVFGDQRPSRADVIRAAAARYNLDPRMVGAIILAEQRDQSQLEDAKDYAGATHPLSRGNTSIGLGQVVISTARNNNLFSDLIDAETVGRLSHEDYARLLSDDTVNIFATAQYIRSVADRAASAPPEVQARFQRDFPGVDFTQFRQHSSTWSRANIEVLGSEYTTSPWDLRADGTSVDSPGWGFFVGEAYNDVNASRVFD